MYRDDIQLFCVPARLLCLYDLEDTMSIGCCCIDFSVLMHRDDIQLFCVPARLLCLCDLEDTMAIGCCCIDYSVLMYRDDIQLYVYLLGSYVSVILRILWQ